jgi:type II secretion system protein D
MKRIDTRALLLASLAALVLAGQPLPARAQDNTIFVPDRTTPNQAVAFSFHQASIDDVLRFLARITGKIVFKDSAVSTTITIRNQNRIPVAQAVKLVQTILALKGYTLIETPDSMIVQGAQAARTGPLGPVSTGRDLASIPAGGGVITHIFPLQSADAVRVAQELNPLFPAGSGILFANSDTNSLVVIDEADKVRRVALILQNIDRPLTDEITVEAIHLMYADAAEVARYLTDLFRPDAPTPGGGGGGGGGGFPGFPFPGAGGAGGPGAGAGAGAAGQRGTLAALRGRVRFAADERSNTVLVYASPANIQQVRSIISKIDVDVEARTEYRIVPLQFSDATALADQLNQLVDPTARPGGAPFFTFGGANAQNQQRGLQNYRVVPDVRTNSLIITAPVDGVDSLVDLIRQLDRPSQVQSVVRVFQLQNAIASEVATTLRSLFQGTQQAGGVGLQLFGAGNAAQLQPGSPLALLRQVTIIANDQTNQLLVSGPSQTFEVIESLLKTDTGLDRRLPQVFIEVVIADITLDAQTKFGIEWNAIAGQSAFGTNFGLTSPNADNTGFRYSVLSKNIQATLQALKDQNKVKIVSTPHVLVTDNSPALVSIGESIPYAGQTTITNGAAQTSTEFQDVAITLNVTPHISPGNHVLMDIDQVVNSLIEFINVGPNQQAPRTTARRAGTTVIVKNDQTVVLGGIISNNDNRNVQKIPILGDIPLLGQLFRNTTRSRGRTELVVFLTPHVVREDEDANDILQYERHRLQVDPLKTLDAPFVRPLEIGPQDLKRIREGKRQGAQATP